MDRPGAGAGHHADRSDQVGSIALDQRLASERLRDPCDQGLSGDAAVAAAGEADGPAPGLAERLGGLEAERAAEQRVVAGRGVSVEGGTATVDLSGSALRVPAGRAERWPLQALVHTLTQFPTVRRVLVQVEGRAVGKPLARDPALPLAPIALAEPTPGTQVKGHRLVVKGEASVYEGTVGLRLRDDHGQTMAQAYATAAQGAPSRGPFSGALTFTPPATSHSWTLEAFEVSPESGPEAAFGTSTMRAVLNFPISDLRKPRAFVRAKGSSS